MSDLQKIKAALIAGAKYYNVSYGTGVSITSEGGSNIVYDHDNKIITSSNDKAWLVAVIEKAKNLAQKEIDRF